MYKKFIKYSVFIIVFFAAALIIIPHPRLKEGMSFSRALYDRNGKLLRITLSEDDKYRLWVPISKFPESLKKATLMKEDKYFYWHFGVNPVSLISAARQTYIKNNRMGGSTITMQLARLRYGINSATISGKLLQIIRAVQIEFFYSKNKILEAYLNLAPYGGNIEGAGAASRIYFEKSPGELTLAEAVSLVVIPQQPAERTLYLQSEGEGKFKKTRRRLLEKWFMAYPDDKKEFSESVFPLDIKRPDSLPFHAPHFTDKIILEDISITEHIHTTLDLDIQEIIERKLKNYVESKNNIGIYNAAALLVNRKSMEVIAAVGSADYFNDKIQGQVNGYAARRSPGSTLKPFVYALGMEQGLIHPMTMLKDSPSRFGGFSPENYDGKFMGPVKVRDALIRSRNVPAVQVASKLDSPNFYKFLKQCGINLPFSSVYYGLAPVLGGAEVSMEELVKLYAMLANGGVLKDISNRKDLNKNTKKNILSREASLIILDILKDVPRPKQGYQKDWVRDSIPVYWKTGTSYAYRDAWSVGITGQYVLAVWIGNFDGESNPEFIGAKAAAPLFFNIIDAIKPHIRTGRKLPYTNANLTEVEVCAVSGDLPNPHCPYTVKTLFIPGKSPIGKCDIHRLVLVDKKSGLRVSLANAPNAVAKVYEFWPSDLLKIFKQAGIPRRVPPPRSDKYTGKSWGASSGNAPQIISPSYGVTYNIRINASEKEKIPLAAVTDADVKEIYWFADSKYIAKTKNNETYFWKPKLGKSVIRVIDDYGRSAARDLIVSMVE